MPHPIIKKHQRNLEKRTHLGNAKAPRITAKLGARHRVIRRERLTSGPTHSQAVALDQFMAMYGHAGASVDRETEALAE
jgi:hypothetical protein